MWDWPGASRSFLAVVVLGGRMDGARDVRATTVAAAAADRVAGKVWRREGTREGRG